MEKSPSSLFSERSALDDGTFLSCLDRAEVMRSGFMNQLFIAVIVKV